MTLMITEVSAPKWARIPVHYRTMSSRQFGGILITTGYITARELFRDDQIFKKRKKWYILWKRQQ